MNKEIRKQENTPADERSRIGTPAGEKPSKGRERHDTKCLTDVCGPDDVRRRSVIEDEEDISEEDYYVGGDEISTTGGITGTKVKGGIPPGGTTEGGTPAPRREPGKPAEDNR